MKIFRLALVIAGVFALGVSSFAQVTPVGKKYLFRLKLSPKEIIRYAVPFTVQGMDSGQVHLELAIRLHVLSVKKGSALVQGYLSPTSLGAQQLDPGRTTQFNVDSRGSVESAKSLGLFIHFPEEAIPVGASFTSPVNTPLMTGKGQTSSATATFTFKGVTTVDGHKVARLTFIVSGEAAPRGSVLVDLADGVTRKYFTKFRLLGLSDKPLDVTASISRL